MIVPMIGGLDIYKTCRKLVDVNLGVRVTWDMKLYTIKRFVRRPNGS